MKATIRRLLLALVAVVAFFAWACGAAGECPCGAGRSDDLAQHDLSFAGQHELSGKCVCHCGDGPLFARPKDGDCNAISEPCERSGGTRAQLSCY